MALTDLHRDAPPDQLHEAKRHKANVRAASTANVTLASAVENGDVLDGVTLATGNRILLKNQTAGAENGVYTVNASGAPTRATDCDAAAELFRGFLVYVEEGTTNAATVWAHTTIAAITLGITALTFAQVGAGGSGTVTSVALTAPAEFSVSGSPVTGSGTLAIGKANQSANQVYAGPTSGGAAAPAFRAMVSGDLPSAPTVSGEITASDFKPTGLTGAVSASRYVGATASVAPTTGTFLQGDWVITLTGKIYVCTTAGSPGTWTQVGAGGAASMTIQEVDASPSVSATTLILPNGTLTDNGGGSVTYTPAGGGSLTSSSAQLGSNVTLGANSYTDILSLSLAAGTWMLIASVDVESTSGGPNATVELTDGTTVAASGEASFSGASAPITVSLVGLVAPGSTTTWKVRGAGTTANVQALAAAHYNGVGNNATTLVAVKIA